MAKLVECIPNFSCSKEKDEATYNALVEAANSVPGCTLFDAQTDGNHNRCVFTLIGDIKAIEEVAFQLTKVATERIDMTRHKGEHKRMGATDVIPFVPQSKDVTVEECVELSKRVAQRIWDELKVPSFLYEDSATRPERRNLPPAARASLRGCRRSCFRRIGLPITASGRSIPPPASRPSAPVCPWSRSTSTWLLPMLRLPRRSRRSSAAPPAASAAARLWAL